MFSNSTMLESMLIAKCNPLIRIFHRGGPSGQLSYKGQYHIFPKRLCLISQTSLPNANKRYSCRQPPFF